jgi:hypothetical protein
MTFIKINLQILRLCFKFLGLSLTYDSRLACLRTQASEVGKGLRLKFIIKIQMNYNYTILKIN